MIAVRRAASHARPAPRRRRTDPIVRIVGVRRRSSPKNMKYERAVARVVALDVDRDRREHVPGVGARSLDPAAASLLHARRGSRRGRASAFAGMPTAGLSGIPHTASSVKQVRYSSRSSPVSASCAIARQDGCRISASASGSARSYRHHVAAVDHEDLTVHQVGVARREEHRRPDHVLGLGVAPHRRHRGEHRLEVDSAPASRWPRCW